MSQDRIDKINDGCVLAGQPFLYLGRVDQVDALRSAQSIAFSPFREALSERSYFHHRAAFQRQIELLASDLNKSSLDPAAELLSDLTELIRSRALLGDRYRQI